MSSAALTQSEAVTKNALFLPALLLLACSARRLVKTRKKKGGGGEATAHPVYVHGSYRTRIAPSLIMQRRHALTESVNSSCLQQKRQQRNYFHAVCVEREIQLRLYCNQARTYVNIRAPEASRQLYTRKLNPALSTRARTTLPSIRVQHDSRGGV